MRGTRWGAGIVIGLLASACASAPPGPVGRVGELRGRIVRIDREQGRIAVAPAPEAEPAWLHLTPDTSVRGPAVASVEALRSGERVYVRYLQDPGAEPPRVLSITVVRYTLIPKRKGPGSFEVPGF